MKALMKLSTTHATNVRFTKNNDKNKHGPLNPCPENSEQENSERKIRSGKFGAGKFGAENSEQENGKFGAGKFGAGKFGAGIFGAVGFTQPLFLLDASRQWRCYNCEVGLRPILIYGINA